MPRLVEAAGLLAARPPPRGGLIDALEAGADSLPSRADAAGALTEVASAIAEDDAAAAAPLSDVGAGLATAAGAGVSSDGDALPRAGARTQR